MKRIQPYPTAVALSFVFGILYLICVGLHLFLSHSHATWPMFRLWEMILPGFVWHSPLSLVLGAIEILFGGFYVAYTLITLLNFFNSRFSESGGEDTMQSLRLKPIMFAVTAFGIITYLLCLIFDLIFPQWAMTEIWRILLPGFEGTDFQSAVVGLIGVVVYCLYISVLFVPIYNFFRVEKLPKL